MKDGWNDEGFYTLFHLYYVNPSGKVNIIGDVKIIEKGMEIKEESYPSTKLPDEFEALSTNFCSLGDSQSYYEELANLPENVRNNILNSLKDCVADQDIFLEFKEETAMEKSLLRNITIKQVETKFKEILYKNATLTPFKFQYALPRS